MAVKVWDNQYCVDEAQELFDKANFQDYFYLCLYGELAKVFGPAVTVPQPPLTYSLWDAIAQVEGTDGWFCALKESCRLCGSEDILKKYDEFEWSSSDVFDDLVGNRMVEVVLKGDRVSPYYKYVTDKNGGIFEMRKKEDKEIEKSARGAESSWVEVNRKDGEAYWCVTKDGKTNKTAIKSVNGFMGGDR